MPMDRLELPATLPRKGNGQGRTSYSPKLAQEIIERYAAGEPMDQLIADLRVSRHGMALWSERVPAFAEALARAKAIHAAAQVDLALKIADDTSLDLLDQGDGKRFPNSAGVASRKLRVETRIKLAGFLDPKAWGEKTMLTGADGASSPFTSGGEYDMARLSPDEAATLAALIAKMRKVRGADSDDGNTIEASAED